MHGIESSREDTPRLRNPFAEYHPVAPAVASWLAVCNSKRWKATLQMADRVTDSPLPILVVGECGAGKEELVYRMIARREPKSMVHVDCGQLGAQLMTGGSSSIDWYGSLLELRSNHTGTWFFDGVDELPLELQSIFADLIGELRDSDGSTTSPIATVRRSAIQLLQDGQLREDLYHSIAVIELAVPNLRERFDDVPTLVKHFATSARPRICFSPAAMDTLCRYPWPGNIAELQNVVARFRVMSDRTVIDADELSALWQRSLDAEEPAEECLNLETAETRLILSAVEQSSGNKTLAARRLGISTRTLHNKMRKYRTMGLIPNAER